MRCIVLVASLLAAGGTWGCSGSDSMGGGHMMGASPGQSMMGNAPSGMSMVGVSPAAGMRGVPVDTPIGILFSAAMPYSMQVQVDLHVGDTSGPLVPLTCAASGDRTRLTCMPLSPLRPNTTYVTHVGGGMGLGGLGCGAAMPMMGGYWMGGGMMTPTHGGMSWSAMSSWADGCGGYGMAFPFVTA